MKQFKILLAFFLVQSIFLISCDNKDVRENSANAPDKNKPALTEAEKQKIDLENSKKIREAANDLALQKGLKPINIDKLLNFDSPKNPFSPEKDKLNNSKTILKHKNEELRNCRIIYAAAILFFSNQKRYPKNIDEIVKAKCLELKPKSPFDTEYKVIIYMKDSSRHSSGELVIIGGKGVRYPPAK